MGLRDIQIHTTKVAYNGQTIEVRGISGGDIMLAAQDYGPQMLLAFNQLRNGEDIADTKQLIAQVGNELPELMAAVIALACDDYSPEGQEIARKLPAPLQAEIMEAIYADTFYNEAKVKKLLESLTKALAAISGALTEVKLPTSELGIGESDKA